VLAHEIYVVGGWIWVAIASSGDRVAAIVAVLTCT
jgi:hypothetical protein